MNARRPKAVNTLALLLIAFLGSMAAEAQSLAVLPVNIFLAPGQMASSMTVTNQGTSGTAIQIRAYVWNQKGGDDQLIPSDNLVVSPPIASIAPGATQVVRLILRHPPEDQEATYRILIDQIPPPAQPGVVHIVLRLSIPIFALPTIRAVPQVEFHMECDKGQLFLVGTNNGLRHASIRDIVLSTRDGRELKTERAASPYILAGTTRRWLIPVEGPLPDSNEPLRMTAHADYGAIEEQVHVLTAR